MEFKIRSIVHGPAYRKYNIVMQRWLLQRFTYSPGNGPKARIFLLKMEPFYNFYIDEAHTELDIFRFVVFLLNHFYQSKAGPEIFTSPC